MTTPTEARGSGPAPAADAPVWHTLNAIGVLQAEQVDERSGLSSAEAAARAGRFGPNEFAAGAVEPRWLSLIHI